MKTKKKSRVRPFVVTGSLARNVLNLVTPCHTSQISHTRLVGQLLASCFASLSFSIRFLAPSLCFMSLNTNWGGVIDPVSLLSASTPSRGHCASLFALGDRSITATPTLFPIAFLLVYNGRKLYVTCRGLLRVRSVVSGYLHVDDQEALSTVSSAFVENSDHPSSYTRQTWAHCSSNSP